VAKIISDISVDLCEKFWEFRNKVVHGQTEHFKQSKASRILQETVRNLYQQFAVDPFMLPESRRYLFNRPIEATLQMDPESLKAWKRSVKEGLFTREHREQLAAKAFKRTLHCFFPYRSDSRKVVAAKRSSL
jgi:glycyl-tRNA synthetase beta subunit